VHHTLSVGEVYDKAIDLCLRNAGRIALTLGLVCLTGVTLSDLGNPSGNDWLLQKAHIRPHGPAPTIWWLGLLATLLSLMATPVVSGILCKVFDGSLRGENVELIESFGASLRHTVNIVVAMLVLNVYVVASASAIFIGYVLIAFAYIKQPAIGIGLGLVAFGIAVWLISLLMIGTLMGFARVVLDEGRVIASMRHGIALAFAKANNRRALFVGAPILLLSIFQLFGAILVAGVTYAWTGWAAVSAISESAIETAAWCLTIAVATIYYRNLTPAA
jgi:hypothetical protein